MKSESIPRLILHDSFDERAALEATMKGWFGAEVELEGGLRYAVHFFDPVRLQQELEMKVELGRPYFSEPGLIVLPEVTVEAAQAAVESLWREGFFANHPSSQAANPKVTVFEERRQPSQRTAA